MKISIVIPVYNRANFLREAVQSVLNQNYQDIEIIVVDDGSTDDIDSVIASFGKKIRYFYQENQGPGAARNKGIVESKGELISFLDSDDLFLPKKLEEQVRLFNKKNIGLVHSYYYQIDKKNNRKRIRKPSLSSNRLLMQKELLNREHTIRTSTVVMRKECFEKVGMFNEDYLYSQDWDMWLRTASEYDFKCVEKPLSIYRRHGGNRVKTKDNSFHSLIKENAKELFGFDDNFFET